MDRFRRFPPMGPDSGSITPAHGQGQHRQGKEGGPAMAIRDILRNTVKEKLARGEVVASMTVRLVRTVEIARIANTAGFDSLYVDLEHSSFSLETCGQICMAAVEAGIAPFVRVPANTPDYIARVLEGGALGIIAPHVRSADEARAAARTATFSPLGGR